MVRGIRSTSRARDGCIVTTDPVVRGENGFTLIEVMVAMLILAIGLLGLEALGLGAARSLTRAKRQSSFATLASDSLESALHQLRSHTIPRSFCQEDLRWGDRLSREVDLSDPQLARVVVRVLPAPEAPGGVPPFEVSSALYLPVPLVGAPAGAPCA